ncbi:EAL domain-containing protein [Glaciihabitans arcticus]|nr:EAL domain-containing protein [Glaciihabitans arcticus]
MVDTRLETELRGAVERGELISAFQPQFDLATNRIAGVETLCRWRHPELGLLMPYAFIPIAEASDLIHEIGRFMLDEACDAAGEWQASGKKVCVAVNVSPVQLTSDDIVDHVIELVRRLEIAPDGITLEITETSPILDLEAAAGRLKVLRRLGLCISIDDYGTGHSSLSRLDALDANELKIDQSLVKSNSAEVLAHLEGVVKYAHERGIGVVAEGVETEEQLARVKTLGCDRAQGFLLGRPMSKRDLDKLLVSSD